MEVRNSSYITRIFSKSNKRFVDPISDGIGVSEINHAALDTHKKNCVRMSQRPDTYIPVIPDYVPIPPRSAWYFNETGFSHINKCSYRTDIYKGVPDILNATQRLLKLAHGQLAVELSGGLDTAIVIGILRDVGLEPDLIGAISERYEFRTERRVQEIIAKDAKSVKFIAESDSLPFSKLKNTPVHSLPNKSSLFYYLNEVTALWAQRNNRKYIVNGIGFDSILIDEISLPSRNYRFDSRNLDDAWANDYVFSPRNVVYVNPASIFSIQKTLVSMRAGLGEDIQKLWARQTFKEFIPNELSDFMYKASFAAVYEEGLEAAREDILTICSEAKRLTGIAELGANQISRLIDGFKEYNHNDEFEFLARVSFANWIYQLEKAGILLN